MTKALDEVASVRGGGITAGQVALAWLLAHSPVMLPIPGTGSVAHLGGKHGGRGVKFASPTNYLPLKRASASCHPRKPFPT